MVNGSDRSVAGYVARLLKARGVDRVFALCGGHIMPLWMAIDSEGIAIVDVRDERAAVYMAHAYGELRGTIGVALVTAGPGVTNAITGIANAHVARAPLVVLSGVPPRPQEGRGALQDLPHVELVRPLARYARTLREPAHVPAGLDDALACPDRTVCVVTGDGAFGFNAMEIDTAVRHRVPVLVVVANNGAWQIEVDDQERRFGRVTGTRLQFADHAAMARALGMYAERVEHAEDLAAAIDRALARRPALLDVVVSPTAPSSDARSGLARVPDLQALDAWDEAERAWRGS